MGIGIDKNFVRGVVQPECSQLMWSSSEPVYFFRHPEENFSFGRMNNGIKSFVRIISTNPVLIQLLQADICEVMQRLLIYLFHRTAESSPRGKWYNGTTLSWDCQMHHIILVHFGISEYNIFCNPNGSKNENGMLKI